MIVRSIFLSLLTYSSAVFSQTTATSKASVNKSAYQEYLRNESDLSSSEKKDLRRMDRAERKATRNEERRIRRSSKKCPYNTTRCTFDWRDY